MNTFRIRRIYDPPARDDGVRVLVDRLWPRGIRKDPPAFDLWLKDIAPSTELRTWYRHQPDRWDEFRQRYIAELDEHSEALAKLYQLAEDNDVTLLYAAKDTRRNHAVVLMEFITR